MSDDTNGSQDEESLHNKRLVARFRIVFAENTVPAICRAASFDLHHAACAKRDVEMTNDTLSKRYDLTVHKTADLRRIPGTF